MEKRFINSSHLSIVSHDGKDMFVDFRNGACYRYSNVPYSTFDSLTKNDSAGSFFHSYVRDKFICKKL